MRLTRKSYAAIYVANESDVPKVKEIIKRIDEFEYNYLPKNLIKPFSEYPKVEYTHRFCDMDMDILTAVCWSEGVMIWAFDAGDEYPTNQAKALAEKEE